MSQESYLKELTEKLERGEISKDEFISLVQNQNLNKEAKPNFLNNIKILYIPGALILLFGVLALVSQFWFLIGFIGRIFITLILGLVFAGVGSFFLIKKSQDKVGSIFHAIGGVLIIYGINIFLAEILNSFTYLKVDLIFYFVFSIFYLLLFIRHKSQILFFFTTFFISIFLINLFVEIMQNINQIDYFTNSNSMNYFFISLGVGYLVLSYAIKDSLYKGMKRFLNIFGTIFILSSIYFLMLESIPWQILYSLILFLGIYLATIYRSTAILVLNTIYFIIFLGYITSKYFSESIGWPLSLIILGFSTIAMVFLSATIFQRFINKTKI